MACKKFAYLSLIGSAIHHTFAYPNATLIEQDENKCSAGTYSLTEGSPPCYDCLAGSYSKEKGVTSCTPARAGYYVPTAAATAESTCKAGSYSGSTGSITCSACPAGNGCPNDALATPQPCSPGTYSLGGNVITCTKCAPGTFNNIQGASGCCNCCANFFNGQEGSTNCQACPNQFPYSSPGTASQGACISSPQLYAIQKSCTQESTGTCSSSAPISSQRANNNRHHLVRRHICKNPKEKACPFYGRSARGQSFVTGHDCVDIQNDLESCGGCVNAFEALNGERNRGGGRDCSAIPDVGSVRCERGQCKIHSCNKGSFLSADKKHCVNPSRVPHDLFKL